MCCYAELYEEKRGNLGADLLRNCCGRTCRGVLSGADLRFSERVKGSFAMQSCMTRRGAIWDLIP